MRQALFYMLLGTVIRCGRIRTYADRHIVRQAGGGACAAVSFSGESAIRAGMNREESAGSAESGNCGAIGWNDGIVWCADSYAWMTIYECAGDEYQTINGVS